MSGGKTAAAIPAITPNPSAKRKNSTVTTKYSPNAFHLKPLVSLQERPTPSRSEEHTSELQSRSDLVCRLLLEKKKKRTSARLKPGATNNPAIISPLSKIRVTATD